MSDNKLTPEQALITQQQTAARVLLDAKIEEFWAFAMLQSRTDMVQKREQAHMILDALLDKKEESARVILRSM